MQFFGSGADDSWFQGQIIERREHPHTSASDYGGGASYQPAGVGAGITGDVGVYQDRRILVKFKGQLGTKVGVAGAPVPATARYADNIEIVNDYTPDSGVRVVSDGGVATLSLDGRGSKHFEVELSLG